LRRQSLSVQVFRLGPFEAECCQFTFTGLPNNWMFTEKTDALLWYRGTRHLMAIQSSGSMRRATSLGCGSGLEDS
jgi:hypothetical protein